MMMKWKDSKEWTWDCSSRHQDVKDVVKPYDWTYTTAYRGTLNDKAVFHEAEEPSIDVARLRKQEPILFYDENILYEDELADNGTTMLSVRLVSSWMKKKISDWSMFDIAGHAVMFLGIATALFTCGWCSLSYKWHAYLSYIWHTLCDSRIYIQRRSLQDYH